MSQTDGLAREHLLAPLPFRANVHRKRRAYRGLRPCDRRLELGSDPQPGAHIVTPRRGYTHHGIYVGDGRVVQYGGLSRGLACGPVQEVTLSEFAQGRPVWVRAEQSRWPDRDEVVRRARMRLGEDHYHVLTNNCEHFCEWCVHGEHRSYQVEEFIARCRSVWHRSRAFLERTLLKHRDYLQVADARATHDLAS